MSLAPIQSIQKCSKCGDEFIYRSCTLAIPLAIKCEDCNNPYFKGYKSKKYFNTDEN